MTLRSCLFGVIYLYKWFTLYSFTHVIREFDVKMMYKWGHLHTKFHTKISLKVIHTPLAKKGDNTLYTQWLHYCEAHQPSSFFLILMCSIFVTSKLLKLIILNLQRFWVIFGKDLTYKSDFLHFLWFLIMNYLIFFY